MDTGIITLNPSELIKWCKQRKKDKGVSNAEISEKTGVPIGTLDRILSGNYVEFKYSSIQPIISYLLEVKEDTPEPEDEDSKQVQYYYNTIEGYKLVLQNKNYEINEMKTLISKLTNDIEYFKHENEAKTLQIEKNQETILKMHDTIHALAEKI